MTTPSMRSRALAFANNEYNTLLASDTCAAGRTAVLPVRADRVPVAVGIRRRDVVDEEVPTLCRKMRKSSAKSEPRWYRSLGSFAMAREITASSCGGRAMSRALAAIGSRFATLKHTVVALLPWNGEWPVTMA